MDFGGAACPQTNFFGQNVTPPQQLYRVILPVQLLNLRRADRMRRSAHLMLRVLYGHQQCLGALCGQVGHVPHIAVTRFRWKGNQCGAIVHGSHITQVFGTDAEEVAVE